MYRWNIYYSLGTDLLASESYTAIKSNYTSICKELLEDIDAMIDRLTGYGATYRIVSIIFVG